MALTATPLRIIQYRFPVANTDDLLYTVSQPKLVIKEIILANPLTSNKYVSLAIVPSGQTLGAQHYVFLRGRALDQESKLFTGLNMVCESGDRIYATSTAADVDLYVSGVEFTTIGS